MNKHTEVEETLISRDCCCGCIEPYGFIPEEDCELHDTPRFYKFVRAIEAKAEEEGYKEGHKSAIRDLCMKSPNT